MTRDQPVEVRVRAAQIETRNVLSGWTGQQAGEEELMHGEAASVPRRGPAAVGQLRMPGRGAAEAHSGEPLC